MTTWGNICRICSCQAEYEVFAKIPTYLHTNSNEFINWQKPINVLLEETTGFKVSTDDGLPKHICALCISYLKHAVNFREQTLSNALSLKLIIQYRGVQNFSNDIQDNKIAKSGQTRIHEDKESFLVTSADLANAPERETDANTLLNNANSVEQNKVEKKLINNVLPLNMPRAPASAQIMEQQMQYLNLLFNKHKNAGLSKRQRNMDSTSYSTNAFGKFADDEFQTATTSSEDSEDTNSNQPKEHMFSYEERNFEEDDITELDDIRDSISVNIPESCKERKCRACFRRYMFEDTYNDHINTCIEYKFLCFIEDVNRLLEIRRSKSVSPHEFIRRMIFSIRKICEWLKLNCHDMLLPDLLMNNNEYNGKKRSESEGRSSSSLDIKATTSNKNTKYKRISDIISNDINKIDKLPIESVNNSTFETIKPNASGQATPINMCNNILYEIERSQSRQHAKNYDIIGKALNGTKPNAELQKPIPLLATNISAANTNTSNSSNGNNTPTSMSLLEKLQKASEKQSELSTPKRSIPPTPQISVRKDLLKQNLTAIPQLNQNSPKASKMASAMLTARCNPCNIGFETLDMLELHNALKHNTLAPNANCNSSTSSTTHIDEEAEAERRRIIALFEESSEEEA